MRGVKKRMIREKDSNWHSYQVRGRSGYYDKQKATPEPHNGVHIHTYIACIARYCEFPQQTKLQPSTF